MPEPEKDEVYENLQRYKAACHAMQSAVAFYMGIDPSETTPKHLRVGINSAMVEHGALVRLLIKKGVLTLGEYYSLLADCMEEEVADYSKRFPPGVKFS